MNEKRPLKLNTDVVAVLVVAVATVLLGVQLHADQAYMFTYREAQQLLFLDWSYIVDLVAQFGGVGIFLSQFLVQFFIHLGVGAIVTALLAGGTAWMLWLTLRKINNRIALLPLTMLPALVQIIQLVLAYHHYSGLVALFFVALALWGYSLCRNMEYKWHFAVGMALSLVLYLTIGSIGMLFALCALLFDAMLKRDKWYLGVLYACVVAVVGSYLVQRGEIIDYE